MSFRRRLLLACAAAVAGAVALAAVLAYALVRDTLREQVDSSLQQATRAVSIRVAEGAAGDAAEAGDVPAEALRGPVLFTQVFAPDGRPDEAPQPARPPGPLVSGSSLREVALGRRPPFFTEREYRGSRLRIFVDRAATGQAIVVARPLAEMQAVLARLRLGLALVILAGIGLALVLGRLATRTAVKPVAELTGAAEHVARTRDLTRRISAEGDDELSRLAASFNTMLEALEHSQRAQRRLVADASHELRTPLTSLRTNLEVIAAEGLSEGDRERLRADVVAQLEELAGLVGDLVDLAREESAPADCSDVRLDELVAAAVCRARRHAPLVEFDVALEGVLVHGMRGRLDRAVSNLLDNAAKWSPPGTVVEVRLAGDGTLSVRDHGPGIAEQDLPYVFDRFYRAPGARGTPGSGLGLAIVRQVAEVHGGSVSAGPAEDGGAGALLVLTLPVVAVGVVAA
jgi:two-component system sensor histidine kinase MprB